MFSCKTSIEPLYEIKLFDDNWIELEKDESNRYVINKMFEYDGEEKGINAIAYKNGVEFYRCDYKKWKGNWGEPIKISINTIPVGGMFRDSFPKSKGKYRITYYFKESGNLTYDSPAGNISG